jgi:hypothetical protein
MSTSAASEVTGAGMGQVRMGKLQRLVYSSDGFPLSENGDFDGKH